MGTETAEYRPKEPSESTCGAHLQQDQEDRSDKAI